MNNSKIAQENIEEKNESRLSILQRELGEMTQIIEAILRVEQTEDWQKLKKLLLDGTVRSIERAIQGEAEKKEISTPKIYHLQGQLAWAKKYADLKKLAEVFKAQAENLKNQVKKHE